MKLHGTGGYRPGFPYQGPHDQTISSSFERESFKIRGRLQWREHVTDFLGKLIRKPYVLMNTTQQMSITPKAIQDLLDELESSRQARRRAWDVLQELRAVLTNLGNVTIVAPSRKSFEIEGAILKQALSSCLRDQRTTPAQLADTARQVDKAAFGSTVDFGPAHQALLKALDRAEALLQG